MSTLSSMVRGPTLSAHPRLLQNLVVKRHIAVPATLQMALCALCTWPPSRTLCSGHSVPNAVNHPVTRIYIVILLKKNSDFTAWIANLFLPAHLQSPLMVFNDIIVGRCHICSRKCAHPTPSLHYKSPHALLLFGFPHMPLRMRM